MDIQELKRKMLQLPIIRIGIVANDNQVLEGDENGCHYIITRETPLINISYYSLSVSGPKENKTELIEQVKSFMGEPLSLVHHLTVLPGITFVLWNAEAVINAGRLK